MKTRKKTGEVFARAHRRRAKFTDWTEKKARTFAGEYIWGLNGNQAVQVFFIVVAYVEWHTNTYFLDRHSH